MFCTSVLSRPFLLLAIASLSFGSTSASAEEDLMDIKLESCLMKRIKTAPDSKTVGELRKECKTSLKGKLPENPGVISERFAQERSTLFDPYVITPHKMNYILPVTVTDDLNRGAYRAFNDWADELQTTEAKMQISFKVPLNTDSLFVDNDALFFGFTLQSWWQVYSDNISKPFRETNYQPEFFYTTPLDWSLAGSNSAFMVGVEHQSNGRSQAISRSWNRIYLNWLFEYEDFALSFKPWYRIPEDKKTDPMQSDGDDNRDIDDFMGYFELGMAYKWDEYEFQFRGHHNSSTRRGGAELGFTFPLWGKLRGYAQYFGGYGESLIDYNHSQNRFGIGIALTDML